jgi:hypothetical protein
MLRIIAATFALACCLAGAGAAGELCLVPSEANGFNVSVDCIGVWLDNDWSGFRSGGGEPCASDPDWITFACTAHGREFCWTASRSAIDACENVSPWGIGTRPLYFWYYCTDVVQGFASAGVDLAGSISVFGFTPMNGFVNAGDEIHLLLSVDGCPCGPVSPA